jgi:hypothetical protein
VAVIHCRRLGKWLVTYGAAAVLGRQHDLKVFFADAIFPGDGGLPRIRNAIRREFSPFMSTEQKNGLAVPPAEIMSKRSNKPLAKGYHVVSAMVTAVSRSLSHIFPNMPTIRLIAGLSVEGDAHMGER